MKKRAKFSWYVERLMSQRPEFTSDDLVPADIELLLNWIIEDNIKELEITEKEYAIFSKNPVSKLLEIKLIKEKK